MTPVPPWRIERRRYDDPDAAGLIAALQDHYREIYGGPDDTLVDPAEFDPPDGLFLIALDAEGLPVGSGGWRRHEGHPDVVEIKRMYVAQSARGRGLARTLVGALESAALQAGARRTVLMTGEPQIAAIALYASCGYLATAPYGHYADRSKYPDALFFDKNLGDKNLGDKNLGDKDPAGADLRGADLAGAPLTHENARPADAERA